MSESWWAPGADDLPSRTARPGAIEPLVTRGIVRGVAAGGDVTVVAARAAVRTVDVGPGQLGRPLSDTGPQRRARGDALVATLDGAS